MIDGGGFGAAVDGGFVGGGGIGLVGMPPACAVAGIGSAASGGSSCCPERSHHFVVISCLALSRDNWSEVIPLSSFLVITQLGQ